MNSVRHVKSGFVLLSVFLLLTLATVLVTQLYYQGVVYNSFAPVAMARERAKMLARSGIAVALSQLTLNDQLFLPAEKTEKDAKQKDTKNPEQRARLLLELLLKVQGKWQTFVCEKEKDGIEGKLSICITCEDGKIPLGALIQYKKGGLRDIPADNFKGELFFKSMCELFSDKSGVKESYDALTKFIKNQTHRLVDVSQLLTIKEFAPLREALFYVPPVAEQSAVSRIYLADLFTLWTVQPHINPYTLSSSVKALYGIVAQKLMDQEELKAFVAKAPVKDINWQKEWDTLLQPLYGKEYKSLPPELKALFSLKFEPRAFSVLCYGKVGQIEQKLLAIIARSFNKQGEVFEVKRIYWL